MVLTPDAIKALKALLREEEGYRQFPYVDTTGNETIGIGRNLKSRGISESEAFQLLTNDIVWFDQQLQNKLSFYSHLDENRRIALIDMCFNLGINGLLQFKEMLKALEKQDYKVAALAMLESKWANQVHARAVKLSKMVELGGSNGF